MLFVQALCKGFFEADSYRILSWPGVDNSLRLAPASCQQGYTYAWHRIDAVMVLHLPVLITVYFKLRTLCDHVRWVARVGSAKRGLAAGGLRSSAIEVRRPPESARPSVLSRLDKRPAPLDESDDELQAPAKRVAGQGSVFDRLRGAYLDQLAES